MANERDSGVEVVHGCFSEGGDSILSDFSSKRAHSLYVSFIPLDYEHSIQAYPFPYGQLQPV